MSSRGNPLEGWEGIIPIVSVPFTHSGNIDGTSFEKTIEYIDNTAASGMVLFGIASEFYKLSDAEKEKLARLYFKREIQTKRIVSVTAHATLIAAELAREYEHMGADGLMLLPPFFLQPAKKSIIFHIEKILNTVKIPVLLQIAAGETGTTYSKEEILHLHRNYPRLIFKIEGNPAPKDIIHSLVQASPDIKIFNGYAGIFMNEMLEHGCSGIIPGCSFIEVYTQIYNAFRQRAVEEAERIHDNLCRYILDWMSHCEYIIQVEKRILMRRNVISSDYCRAPAHTLSKSDIEKIESFMDEFDL